MRWRRFGANAAATARARLPTTRRSVPIRCAAAASDNQRQRCEPEPKTNVEQVQGGVSPGGCHICNRACPAATMALAPGPEPESMKIRTERCT